MKGASQIAPFGLRMPEDLKDAIAERAKKNGRSMNSEIVQILEDAIENKRNFEPPLMSFTSKEQAERTISQLRETVMNFLESAGFPDKDDDKKPT